ncbi:MAG TPA: hypothetical protein VK961_14240 [Chthoniobacter sp.]|nr:hypothetical protein [Chthoniobacter sp.]
MHFFKGNEADNAEGVESSSPGLRGTSYPGLANKNAANPERVESISLAERVDSTLSGLALCGGNPRVDAPSSHQPWANRLNAVGVLFEASRMHKKLPKKPNP